MHQKSELHLVSHLLQLKILICFFGHFWKKSYFCLYSGNSVICFAFAACDFRKLLFVCTLGIQ